MGGLKAVRIFFPEVHTNLGIRASLRPLVKDELNEKFPEDGDDTPQCKLEAIIIICEFLLGQKACKRFLLSFFLSGKSQSK